MGTYMQKIKNFLMSKNYTFIITSIGKINFLFGKKIILNNMPKIL